MKKLALVLVLLLVPGFALGQCTATGEGDPAFYVGLPPTQDMIAGEVACWTIGPTNFGFVSATCPNPDTFCIYAVDLLGWTITADPPLEECTLLDPGYLWWNDICIEAPCDVFPCDNNTLTVYMTWCCYDAIGDVLVCDHTLNPPELICEDPNLYSGNPYYSTTAIDLHIVPSPPALYIVQDSLYVVEQGQTAAYVPFTICNGDACAPPTVYNYEITCVDIVAVGGGMCGPFPQAGATNPVPGGECEDVYAIVDAGTAEICDMIELTIIAWVDGTYDTCVQLVHVVEPVPVPLFTTPVVTVLVLAMILAAAVFMRRRVASRA
jgi:hypothetical protein